MKKLILLGLVALFVSSGCKALDDNDLRDRVNNEASEAHSPYARHQVAPASAEFAEGVERWENEKFLRDQRVQEIAAAETTRQEKIAELYTAYVDAVQSNNKDLAAEIRRGIQMLEGTASSYTQVQLINNTDKTVLFRINDVGFWVNPHTQDTPQIRPGQAYVSIEDETGEILWTAEREIPDAGKNQVAYWFSWP